jgi:integrase
VTILFDTGLRTDECFRLQWESITWSAGRHGALLVTHGKSSAARRMLPLTLRVRSVLEKLWRNAREPETGYVWPGDTKKGYIQDETVRRRHMKAIESCGVRSFVLHSLRHTFMTRMGLSGCDAWTLARAVGHSDIRVSSRYVHASHESTEAAILRLPAPVVVETVLAGRS